MDNEQEWRLGRVPLGSGTKRIGTNADLQPRSALSTTNQKRVMIEQSLAHRMRVDRAHLLNLQQSPHPPARSSRLSSKAGLAAPAKCGSITLDPLPASHLRAWERSSEAAMLLALDPPNLLFSFLLLARDPADAYNGPIDGLPSHRRGAQASERPPAATTHAVVTGHPSPSLTEPLASFSQTAASSVFLKTRPALDTATLCHTTTPHTANRRQATSAPASRCGPRLGPPDVASASDRRPCSRSRRCTVQQVARASLDSAARPLHFLARSTGDLRTPLYQLHPPGRLSQV